MCLLCEVHREILRAYIIYSGKIRKNYFVYFLSCLCLYIFFVRESKGMFTSQ